MVKKVFSFIFEVLKIVILALVIVMPIRYFVFQPFIVRGASMEPNFHGGDYLIVDELSYRFRSPERGEVIVFENPQNINERFIKRVIGLPNETVFIDGKEIEITTEEGEKMDLNESEYLGGSPILSRTEETFNLSKDEYFVMGDNRPHSYDSRSWGPLSEKYIIGRVVLRVLPPAALASFPAPEY